jgi:GTPase involved in cell partitioning and DNA repair
MRSSSLSDLSPPDVRPAKEITASDGEDGMRSKRTGRNGQNRPTLISQTEFRNNPVAGFLF